MGEISVIGGTITGRILFIHWQIIVVKNKIMQEVLNIGNLWHK